MRVLQIIAVSIAVVGYFFLNPPQSEKKETKVPVTKLDENEKSSTSIFEIKKLSVSSGERKESVRHQKVNVILNDRNQTHSENAFQKSYDRVHTAQFDEAGESLHLDLSVEGGEFNAKTVLLLSKSGEVLPLKIQIDEQKSKEFLEDESLFVDDWVKLSSNEKTMRKVKIILKSLQKNSEVDVYIQKFKKVEI